jgi:hypothetical protein
MRKAPGKTGSRKSSKTDAIPQVPLRGYKQIVGPEQVIAKTIDVELGKRHGSVVNASVLVEVGSS